MSDPTPTEPGQAPELRAAWLRHPALPWIVAAVGLIASFVVWQALLAFEDQALASRFRMSASLQLLEIRDRLGDTRSAIDSVSDLFAASEMVTEDEFEVFVVASIRRHPYLRAIAWAPLRRSALPHPAAAGGGRGSGPLAASLLVLYTHRSARGPDLRGFDLASVPELRAAVERAGTAAELTLSAPVVLPGEDRARHYVAFEPYSRATAAGSPAAGPLGFVIGVFAMSDIVASALEGIDVSEVSLTVDDITDPERERLFELPGDSAGLAGTLLAPYRKLMVPSDFGAPYAEELTLGGRRLAFEFRPNAALLSGHQRPAPLVSLFAGLALTSLVFAYLFALRERAARVARVVSKRTAQLVDANLGLAREVEQRALAEAELRGYRDQLESIVQERTAELRKANLELRRQIDQRREAEQRARAGEERLRLTLDSVTDGGWDWSLADGTVFFSDRWLHSFGFSRDGLEPHERFWRGLIHDDDAERVRSALQAHLGGQTAIYECEYRMRGASGDYVWIRSRGKIVEQDSAGRPQRMVGTDTDITSRIRAEEHERELERQVQHAQKMESLGVLAGGIAHDFNNLLVGILGSADLALAELPEGSRVRDDLEQIKLAGTRAAELTRQMLDYSGRGRVEPELLDVSPLVKEMAHLVAASISKKALLRFEFAPDLPPIEADATQLRQIVMNLITNASDALGDASGTIAVRTGRTSVGGGSAGADAIDPTLAPGEYVFIEIEDTGAGMDEQTRAKIFEPFFTTKFQGRGLGLAAALGIVRAHRGGIRVRSEPGVGTTFTVCFPVAKPAASPGAGRRTERSAEEWSGSGTILIVDDEPAVRRFAQRVLERCGFDVLTAEDGREGVEQFRRHADAIRAVILDMTMPRLGGLETYRAMSEIRPDIPILVTSGHRGRDAARGFGGPNFAGYLHKPYQIGQLVDLLKIALG